MHLMIWQVVVGLVVEEIAADGMYSALNLRRIFMFIGIVKHANFLI